ncbi:low temperature requirement protein A [Pendulispora rubella]|uniref:Low temperature requirement protein A n=1 Tax=Pendulispora rubella TaxID=2741070 RepID=A0ABZ2L136_9BACT
MIPTGPREVPTPGNGDATQARVSALELFFDLVFALTITQVATVLMNTPDAGGVARAAVELSAIFWMYGGYAWMTNATPPTTWPRRCLLLLGMAGFFLCALAVPRAFDDDGIVFGMGYMLITFVHLAGFWLAPDRAPRRSVYRLAVWNITSASLVLMGGWAHGNADAWLWGGALAVQIATPLLGRAGLGFGLRAAHFAERHGLMILIVLGESLLSVGIAAQHKAVDVALVLGVLAGLALTACMWWLYFVDEDERAAHAFERASPGRKVVGAVAGYGLAHLLMIGGVVAVAAGTRLSVNDLMARTPAFSAWLVAGGVALFLLGAALFRWVLGIGSPMPRVVGAVLVLGAVLVGSRGSAAGELATAALLVAAVLAAERR